MSFEIVYLHYYLTHCIKRPTVCIWENKVPDQLCSKCTADQLLCFKLLTIFCDGTAWFVDLVENLNCCFPKQRHIIKTLLYVFVLL